MRRSGLKLHAGVHQIGRQPLVQPVDLEREIPEALKPRRIEIANGTKAIEKDVVDAKAVN